MCKSLVAVFLVPMIVFLPLIAVWIMNITEPASIVIDVEIYYQMFAFYGMWVMGMLIWWLAVNFLFEKSDYD